MSFRKGIFLVCILCALVFWGKQWALQGASLVVKTYVYISKGWHLSFGSLEWKDRTIIVENCSWDDGSEVSFFAPKVMISLREKHVALCKPRIVISGLSNVGKNASSWNFSIADGTIEGLGFGPFGFSLEASSEKAVGSLIFDSDQSISFDIGLNHERFPLKLSFDNVDLSHLENGIGKSWQGRIDGSIHGEKDTLGIWRGKCHLDISNLGCLNLLQETSLSLDWDGSCKNILFDWDLDTFIKEFLSESFLRVKILQGQVCLAHSTISDLSGDFGIHGSLGAQWDIFGKVKEDVVSLRGKGVYHSLEKSWLESTLKFGKTCVALQTREERLNYVSDLAVNSLTVDSARLFQDFILLKSQEPYFPFFNSFSFHEGIVNGSFRFIWSDAFLSWEVLDFDMKDLNFSVDLLSLSCKTASFQEGIYCFRGGKIARGDYSAAWQSEGNVESKEGCFSIVANDWQLDGDFTGDVSSFQGTCLLFGSHEGEFLFSGKLEDNLSFFIDQGRFDLFSFVRVSGLSLELEANLERAALYNVKGMLNAGSLFSLSCPIVQTEGVFDLRLEKDNLNLVRLVGTSHEGLFTVDVERSLCFDRPVAFGSCVFTKGGLQRGNLEFDVSLKILDRLLPPISSKIYSVFSEPFLLDPDQRIKLPIKSDLVCKIDYHRAFGTEILLAESQKEGTDGIYMHLLQRDALWRLDALEMKGFSITGDLTISKKGVSLEQAAGEWKDHLHFKTTARFTSLYDWDIHVDSLWVDAHSFFPCVEGVVQGDGVIRCQGEIQTDFDLLFSSMSVNGWLFENDEPLHLMSDSARGLLVRGVNVSLIHPENGLSCLHCNVGLVNCDFQESVWKLDDVCLQSNVMSLQDQGPLENVSPYLKKDVQFIADIQSAFDFSYISCFMKEGLIPFQEDVYHVQNLHLSADAKECKMSCEVAHRSLWIPVDCTLSFGDICRGSVTVQKELTIEGFYDGSLNIQSIDGRFLGMGISFREDANSLIGSASVNCHILSQFVPPKVIEVFQELKMGDGYELKGRMRLANDGFYFHGILSGKQVELFGFQFKTLLGQIDITPEHVFISDLKASDLAGVMTIPLIEAKGEKDDPWTISMPHLMITELRPSLLQEVGKKAPATMSPLVIRQLKIENFKGLVDDSKTYQAKGELYFINSYKREESILEIPSNLLSRIVGLDLDLLVPVCGTLRYELKEGKFRLTELANAYSENKRSEFFLVFGEDSPTVDLDWNLNILIKMKQFVLFKFTEAFLISVTGTLGDPEFHLQSKKRFFGFDL